MNLSIDGIIDMKKSDSPLIPTQSITQNKEKKLLLLRVTVCLLFRLYLVASYVTHRNHIIRLCISDYTGRLLSVVDEGVRASGLWARACVGGPLHPAPTLRRARAVPFSGRHVEQRRGLPGAAGRGCQISQHTHRDGAKPTE